jgi:hypothetical protein
MVNNTSQYLRVGNRQDGSQIGRPIVKEEGQEGISPVEAIYCKVCGRAVTGRAHKIAVNGSHTHTFFNPAGIVYELGCFAAAPGCHSAGEATSEFTWFAGYVWRFALCGQCNNHLGWFFETAELSFFGLILANLKE